MIVSVMLFLVAVSMVAGAGALLVEDGLRRMGTGTRFAWLGALASGPLLLLVAAARALVPQAPSPVPAWAPVVELPALSLAPAAADAGWLGLGETAAVVWLLSAVGLVALVLRTHHALLRERSGWESTQVLGWTVFVSADRGPAVAGVWDPWIVLPRWVLALPEAELRMVLLHEGEHLRARDTYLLGAALALVSLTAWNPVTWWQLRRLRAAMEVDCDRRVLRAAPDRATYGASLLTVAARAAGPSLGLAAFTERSLNLKRRILAMTARTTRWTAMGGGVLVVLGLVVGVQACGVESPVGITPQSEAQPVPVAAIPESKPATERVAPRPTGTLTGGGAVFTPFTRAPRLLNAEEIHEAVMGAYPPLLRDAGISGFAQVFMFVDTTGAVQDVRIQQTSGHQPLDDAALRVAGKFRFEPAMDGDRKVEAWVSFPIDFGNVREPRMIRSGREGEDPEPPPAPNVDPAAGPVFTPFTAAPSILNRDEVVAAMVAAYPQDLRDSRVGGTVRVYFFINAEGVVERTLVDRTSGISELDDAALEVAQVYRFTPALNKDQKVPVWVSFPITFMVR